MLREQDVDTLALPQLSQHLAFFPGLLRPSCISRRSIRMSEDSVSFMVVSPKEKRHKTITIEAFNRDRHLCPIRSMIEFLAATDPLRGSSDALFLSTRSPHTPASPQTISRWVAPLIHNANPYLSARCLRSVRSSTALDSGVPLDTIVHIGNWASPATFINFYRRQSALTRARTNISTAILSTDPRSFRIGSHPWL